MRVADYANALVASAEASALLPPTSTGPHEFVGRLDRWCEVCNRPDRNPIHDPVR